MIWYIELFVFLVSGNHVSGMDCRGCDILF